jgi:general secretion pathway protein L
VRETLFLRLCDLRPEGETPYVITAAESVAGVIARQATAGQFANLCNGRRVVVFVPGTDVKLTRVSPPVRQAAKALLATPYLVEDQLADDVEELHFALGARQADGSFPVAALAQTKIDQWLEQLRSSGIEPHTLVPDVLALPKPGDVSWSALADDTSIAVRTGAWSGFTASNDDFELMLKLADAGGNPHGLQLFVMQNDARDFTRLERQIELRPGFSQPIEALARHYQGDSAINLLQGAHARRESWLRYWQPWQLAAGLAAALFVGTLTLNGVDAHRLRKEADAQEAANTQRFSELFPAERPSPYLSAQIDSLIRHASGAGSQNLFSLLQSFAQAQTATPGLTVKGIQFRDGALFLDLTGSDLQVLEKLRSWFTTHPGVHLDVPTADSTSNGVQIRLKLTPA